MVFSFEIFSVILWEKMFYWLNREFSKALRSLEQFIITMKDRNEIRDWNAEWKISLNGINIDGM